jgi:DNA-directed RNA polymerase specialized sigma24 family protein
MIGFTGNCFRDLGKSDHEDIVQDAMLTIIKDAYAKLDKTESMSYLYSICYSKGRDFQRKKYKVLELNALEEDGTEIHPLASNCEQPELASETRNRELAIRKICENYISDAVRELQSPYREIANLLFIDFAYQDGSISNNALFEMIYGKPAKDASPAELQTFRQHKSRARRKLGEAIRSRAKNDPEALEIIIEFEHGRHKSEGNTLNI